MIEKFESKEEYVEYLRSKVDELECIRKKIMHETEDSEGFRLTIGPEFTYTLERLINSLGNKFRASMLGIDDEWIYERLTELHEEMQEFTGCMLDLSNILAGK